MKRRISTYAIPASVLFLTLLLATAVCAEAQNITNNNSTNIAGTWTVLWTSQIVPPFVAMIQFSSDGNLITTETDEFAVSMGVWQRVNGHTYAISIDSFAFDALGQPYTGTFKSNAKLTLTPNSETLSGKFHLDFYDTNGVLQFSDDGPITGYRNHVRPMP